MQTKWTRKHQVPGNIPMEVHAIWKYFIDDEPLDVQTRAHNSIKRLIKSQTDMI